MTDDECWIYFRNDDDARLAATVKFTQRPFKRIVGHEPRCILVLNVPGLGFRVGGCKEVIDAEPTLDRLVGTFLQKQAAPAELPVEKGMTEKGLRQADRS